MKPRSSMLETPRISVSIPATRPPVQDSAVATVSFLRRQISSSLSPAATISSSSIADIPSKPDRGGRIGRDPFTAAGKTEPLAGRRLHGNAVQGYPRNVRDPLAHGVAVRPDFRGLAYNRGI